MSNNENKTGVMFPGQGSQYIGMGKEFLETDPEALELMELAESIMNFPVRKLCLEGPMEELTRPIHLQPAFTVLNLICWNALRKGGIQPDYVIGHSLGEFSALYAAGVLNTEDTLKLVAERGRLMEREGQKNPGGMRAVLGMTLDEIQEILDGLSEGDIVTAANHNSDKQVVISGEVAAMDKVSNIVAEKGGKVIPLNVSIANHSPLVANAVPDFEKVMAGVQFNKPVIPVYFNVTADTEDDPDVIRDIMARQIASRVRWYEIINKLTTNGVQIFIESGPKTVLTGLLRKIVPKGYSYRKFQVDNPDSLAKCLAEVIS